MGKEPEGSKEAGASRTQGSAFRLWNRRQGFEGNYQGLEEGADGTQDRMEQGRMELAG